MKFKKSLFTRRRFLNSLMGGWSAALATSFFAPLLRFVFPPYQEPDEVVLLLSDFADMSPNSTKFFPWGSKPGILKKNDDDSLTAFVGVCTHLDCNITYLPQQRKFFCACHDGWYDENGVNISGPPPRPLRKLEVIIEEGNLIIKKTGKK